MESDRVEMSVGSGTVNGNHATDNSAANGTTALSRKQVNESRPHDLTNGPSAAEAELLNNVGNILAEAPEELLQMISTEFYLPMAKLINRSAQTCWNDLTDLVSRLAEIPVPAQNGPVGMPGLPSNNQTKANLEKKDALLNFAKDHKDVFVKLLVLLQWSKNGEDVRKTIELNFWLVQRRSAFVNATSMFIRMLHDLASAQVPNPDLYTAAEVLATGKVAALPGLGYVESSPLSDREIRRILHRLNHVLCTKLSLHTVLPHELQTYYIHDGRATFTILHEFELDLSLMDEGPGANFLVVDVRFLFSPAPSVSDALHDEISLVTNSAIEKDGLQGAYDFIHDLTLSCKLNELQRQAQELERGLWSECIKVELIRRTLVVQYWLKRPGPRSWIEIGIHSGNDTGVEQLRAQAPKLTVRWMRDGKEVKTHDITLSESKLSIEDIFSQVLSQHVNSIFTAIYDKIVENPLYASAELEAEQSSNPDDPSQCAMTFQLSKSDTLHIQIEPVSGAVVISPVSEQTSRIQFELSRSKNLVDDFVSGFSGLRSAISHNNLVRAFVNSDWQDLPGFRLSHIKSEALFLGPIHKTSFFRRQCWSSDWMLAITSSSVGEYWWLVHGARRELNTNMLLSYSLKSPPLHLHGRLTLAYLDRLADYTTGVIVLHGNAQYLSKRKVPYTLNSISNHIEKSKLPSLRFLQTTQDVHKIYDAQNTMKPASIEFTYHGIQHDSSDVVAIGRTNLLADSSLLSELASSQIDASISILPRQQQILIRSTSLAGEPVVDGIMAKIRHLSNIVACAAIVKKSLDHTLQSLSFSALTIAYNTGSSDEYNLSIQFPTASTDVQLEFLPAGHNPHQYLASHVTQMLTRKNQGLSRNLEEVLALLKMTQPMMHYLQTLQSQEKSFTLAGTAETSSNLIRVHVLPRERATYALQYFTTQNDFVRDVNDAETPKKLLVRLEVLPQTRGSRNVWIVRPAIEEFDSYTRPSFTSDKLRSKLKLEIFSCDATKDWLPLNTGAACGPEHPEKLLSAIHGSIMSWLKEALTVPVTGTQAASSQIQPQPNGISNGSKNNQSSNQQPAAENSRQQFQLKNPPTQRSATNGQPRVNGVAQHPANNQQRQAQNFGHVKNPPNKMKQEVITLD